MKSRGADFALKLVDPPREELLPALLEGVSQSLCRSLNLNDIINHVLDTLQISLSPHVCGIIAMGGSPIPSYKTTIRGLKIYEEDLLEGHKEVSLRRLHDSVLANRLDTWYERELTISKAAKGVLVAGWADKHEIDQSEEVFLATIACLAGVAIDHCLLHQELQKQAVAYERTRIARELHDGLAQSLYSMALQVKVCQKLLYKQPALVEEKLSQLELLAQDDIEEIRHHISFLREGKLPRGSFAAVARDYLHKSCALNSLSGKLYVSGQEVVLNKIISDNLYYLLSECLANIVKHAKAKNVKVNLHFDQSELELQIIDDGHGFDVASLSSSSAARGMGLFNIEHRVNLVGGHLRILSHPGAGTKIIAVVPYDDYKIRENQL